MAYKKYIKKDGKLYGPYVYHSRRVNGKVISEYHGAGRTFNYKKFLLIFFGVFLVMALIYVLIFFNGKISGKAVFDLEANYQEEQPLEGTLKLSLREGELIPASSKIIFETSGQKYEYSLKELVLDGLVEGDFYIKEKSISGSGLGYGEKGTKQIYPTVYFTLDVYSQTILEEILPEEEIEEVEEAEEEIVEEQETESEETPITGNIISRLFLGVFNFFLGLTGQVSMEFGEEVQGEVSAGNPFNYDLEGRQIAEILPRSVRTDSEELPDETLELSIEENKVIVTTDYFQDEQGFGEDYLGDDEKVLVVDLSVLDLIMEQGELKISLVYDEEEIISLTTLLEEGEVMANESFEEEVISNETKVEPNVTTETNQTINATVLTNIINVTEMSDVLTDEERETLFKEFGNASIKRTANLFNERIIVRYELGYYWIEYSYNADAEELDSLMEIDRIKWLKDLVRELSREETIPEKIENFTIDYSI